MKLQSIDPAKVKLLRKMKKSMIEISKLDYGAKDQAFVKAANEFAKQIPHKTDDFIKWNSMSSIGFDTRYTEISEEYNQLCEWSERLFNEWVKGTQIKPEENEENEPSKKETDIKQENKPKSRQSKMETEIKGEQLQISIRGGKRPGAGRKSIGIKKPVSITLPENTWNEIDNLIQKGEYASYADFFRSLVKL